MDIDPIEYFDEEDDQASERHQRKGKRASRPPRRDTQPGKVARFDPVAQLGVETEFQPSFHTSRFEHSWILEYLGTFYEDHYITDVLRQVKGGKEATVYCCQADPRMGVEFIAAKIYRPKIFRTLKNDSEYRQGRSILDEEGSVVRGRRGKLAMRKKTRYRQELLHAAWLENEHTMLQRLHAAEADVPKPIARGNNTLLMEYLGDADMPAPTLNTVELASDEARPLFDRLLHNAELFLRCNCVHADLSAFNILYQDGEVRIIDMPQAVDPLINPRAFQMFERDMMRACQYFHRYGIDVNPRQIARELWRRNVKRDVSEVFLP